MRGAAVALAAALALPARAADTIVQWDTAEQHVGEQVVVEGRVMGVHCSRLSCLLAFDPTFNRFTAVIQAKDFDRFQTDDLDARYSGKRVRVRGTIVTRDRKPEIVLSDPADLKLAETKEERTQRKAEAAEAQDQALERLVTLLERIEALTERLVETQERLAATQERMETAVAQLEASSQALAAAATPPPPPLDFGSGDEQPRPGYEAMRSVKRGMSLTEVRRLIGEPLGVIPGGNGWTTWLYDYGRSVSFDRRGRAQSLVGFPGP
jgi:hypothetical protein